MTNDNKKIDNKDPYFTKLITIKKPKSKYLTNQITSNYPESLFLSLTKYKIYPHEKYTLEPGAIDLKKIKYKNLHWGQRKLLLSEIDFLTDFIDLSKNKQKILIIYAGAADGKHISLLSKMFPNF